MTCYHLLLVKKKSTHFTLLKSSRRHPPISHCKDDWKRKETRRVCRTSSRYRTHNIEIDTTALNEKRAIIIRAMRSEADGKNLHIMIIEIQRTDVEGFGKPLWVKSIRCSIGRLGNALTPNDRWRAEWVNWWSDVLRNGGMASSLSTGIDYWRSLFLSYGKHLLLLIPLTQLIAMLLPEKIGVWSHLAFFVRHH